MRAALAGMDRKPGASTGDADISKFTNKFSEMIKNLEKRFLKLQKMFDLNRLMSKIDTKADEDSVR